LLTLLSFTAAFAVFYAALPDDQFSRSLSAVSAFYSSVVTMATVGYGDVVPTRALSQLIVTGEIAIGVFFLAAIVSTIASWANNQPWFADIA
jgi:voltage-gated potassium channel